MATVLQYFNHPTLYVMTSEIVSENDRIIGENHFHIFEIISNTTATPVRAMEEGIRFQI
jgi:hypothetical protein